jgi:hypothetical protein
MPEGRHRLRFEFEAAGQPASPKARGVRLGAAICRRQLIAHNEFLFTTSIADLGRPPEDRNVYQQTGSVEAARSHRG